MPYSSYQWAVDFLHSLGNPDPSAGTIAWVQGWERAETRGPGGALFNPLNTTKAMPGSTNFNTFGSQGQYHVQNFTSYSQGIVANTSVIENGRYPSLLSALRNNDVTALDTSSAVRSQVGTWGTNYNNILSNIGNNQSFNDSPGSGSTTPVAPGGSGTPTTSTNTTTLFLPNPDQSCPDFGVNPTDWGPALACRLQNLVTEIILFAFGAILIYFGIRLILNDESSIGDSIAGAITKGGSGIAPGESSGGGSQGSSKQGKAQQAIKIAEMAG